MVSPSTPKTLHPLQIFSIKLPTSIQTSMKIKTIIQTVLFSYIRRLTRSLSRVKSVLFRIVTKNQPMNKLMYPQKNKRIKNKIFFGSFRLHYNWCSSSHVMPVPAPVFEGHLYYDSTWDSYISTDQELQCGDGEDGSQLSGYLKWLEERKGNENENSLVGEVEVNEIDKLAEMFIQNCHEKFLLEKQESYRLFQEMLARSM